MFLGLFLQEICILHFYKDINKHQAKTCLGEGSLRGSHLAVNEHLLQQHHHHTDTLHGKKTNVPESHVHTKTLSLAQTKQLSFHVY